MFAKQGIIINLFTICKEDLPFPSFSKEGKYYQTDYDPLVIILKISHLKRIGIW